MSRTRADLVADILSALGVTDSGADDLADEDVAKVDPRLDGIMAELAMQDIVQVSDLDDIPDEVFEHVVAICAFKCSKHFGLPTDERAVLAQERDEAERRLRRMQPEPATYVPMRGEYW